MLDKVREIRSINVNISDTKRKNPAQYTFTAADKAERERTEKRLNEILDGAETTDDELARITYDYGHAHPEKTIYVSYVVKYADGSTEKVERNCWTPFGWKTKYKVHVLGHSLDDVDYEFTGADDKDGNDVWNYDSWKRPQL